VANAVNGEMVNAMGLGLGDLDFSAVVEAVR